MFIKKIEVFGDNAFQHLKNQLKLGRKLSSLIYKNVDLKMGTVHVFVPNNIPPDVINDFSSGGLYKDYEIVKVPFGYLTEVENKSKNNLIDQIASDINSNNLNCCILEEPAALPSDNGVKNNWIDYIIIDGQIYYFFGHDKFELSKFKEAFNTADSFYFLCVVSSYIQEFDQSSLSQEKKYLLEQIIDNIKYFIVKAYDGEGYMMWSSKKLPSTR